ncbi:LOW QUALITY PROTEIN: uncharacterized protein NKAPD1-like [Gopherus evgoodei]|uniref:LOW QUALITY PROTEIN: uncharacterized protein NKAPD1-like n=1 Tax=Gopherus evgoodei TaxID=1825980 RepID=UPI0011CF757F|nr:LOW QUALITY PROTEIN: uncharacterized protein NKAPD1-like [Gopherus evgoodei]
MSRVPLGKVLLRNVIRHTDAHNKIQEESEMWKIRELEKQTQETYRWKQGRMSPNTSSSRMRSDGFDEESQRADWKAKSFVHVPDMTEDDLLRARTWNKKLHECEANMPDRWGHSGYKELYPEEFDTDSDQQEKDEQNAVNGKRKSHPGKQSVPESLKRKRPKKSQKKKRKKRGHTKKRKKRKKEKAKASSDSSQEASVQEGTSCTWRGKHKHKKKTRKRLAKEPASSSGRESDSSSVSSSEDSEPEEKRKWSKKKRRKCPVSALERHSEIQEKQNKRKNWKVAADEKSEDSSDED